MGARRDHAAAAAGVEADGEKGCCAHDATCRRASVAYATERSNNFDGHCGENDSGLTDTRRSDSRHDCGFAVP
jgi:hypothetical protein